MLASRNQRTTVFITHRLDKSWRADKIFYLIKGKLIESGTSAQLLKIKDGQFAKAFHNSTQTDPYDEISE